METNSRLINAAETLIDGSVRMNDGSSVVGEKELQELFNAMKATKGGRLIETDSRPASAFSWYRK